MKKRFQAFAFKCNNVYHYIEAAHEHLRTKLERVDEAARHRIAMAEAAVAAAKETARHEVGLYKLNPVYP